MSRFEEIIERRETSSVKWDRTRQIFNTKQDILPMWVADMDFLPPKAVTDALKSRVDHGIFGYTYIAESVGEAISDWLLKRHSWDIKTNWLMYSSGVVPSIGHAIQALTEPGDKVMIQSPVYPPFFSMIENNDRVIENCPLIERESHYQIDFEAFEASLKSGVKMFLLCHPHNPVGRVWTKAELEKIAELCLENDVIIISDEIHSDLIFEPYKHIPIASLSEQIAKQTITLIAPSKTFNLAGLQASAIISSNPTYRKKIQNITKKQGFFTLNSAGIIAMEAAYLGGEQWLDELLDYLNNNIQTVNQYFSEHLPQLKLIETQATYLLWIDCRKLHISDEELKTALTEKGKLGLNLGPSFGEGGEGFVRMNVACPRATLLEGLSRLKKAVESV